MTPPGALGRSADAGLIYFFNILFLFYSLYTLGMFASKKESEEQENEPKDGESEEPENEEGADAEEEGDTKKEKKKTKKEKKDIFEMIREEVESEKLLTDETGVEVSESGDQVITIIIIIIKHKERINLIMIIFF